ncbi:MULTISPECIES: relaxase/mobilization nuclease domain-containing protein [unclassified Rhodococcus (in: high G+C Gram-positive bacteria)]|uniref:relaxase/mobilization nuclease domain-containing protein n=1 Tax=unclassified Rhodococcus (in: high G+C Gram-positive bacteria) TaxID=192944 RepID=UPI001C9B0003|nr:MULTISPECIES: relaxase/mobilization nuclease domain-containing protein [unclassified Rhodococcus (in: high G+C Gram-positive bacteria)]MBY6709084.1 hypothetical protein [Rhodococcus sp. BP-241]
MIPNITRGAKMTGLVSYLAGPGRSNEHENPHIVAGHESVILRAPTGELSHAEAIELAHEIDTARVVFGTEVSYTNRRRMNAAIDDGTPRSVALADATSDRNVWHCSLSLNPDEGELSDEKWGAIAGDFMREMGFDDPESPRPSARWVAIRHGKTTAGGDHIHIAASAVREDGTKVDTFNDFKRAQAACNALERTHGLVVLTSRENDRGTRGVKPAEAARATRTGASETSRALLERRVRACATASKTEAEFVRRLRAQKVLMRPRYDTGTTGTVVGYSVATTPTAAERAAGTKPVWYGGGRLAKDLTLPRLRDEWDTTGTAPQDAAAEWSAARRGTAVTITTGRERTPLDPELIARAAEDIGKWNTYLTSIPIEDTAQWARAAGRTAGVFAAWSARTEPTPGPLAKAAAALAQSAQIPAYQRITPDPERRHAGGAALIMMQAALATRGGAAANALLLRQMMRTMEAFADAERAAGHAHQAHTLTLVRERELTTLHERLLVRVGSDDAHSGGAPTRVTRRIAMPPEAGEIDRAARRAAGEDIPQPPAARRTVINDLPAEERDELLAMLERGRAQAVDERRVRRGVAGDGAHGAGTSLSDQERDQGEPER